MKLATLKEYTGTKNRFSHRDCWMPAKPERLSIRDYIALPHRKSNAIQRGGNQYLENDFIEEVCGLDFKDNPEVTWTFAVGAVSTSQILLEQQFKELSEKWRNETGGYSTSKQITNNKTYKDIIGLGPKVLPLIFKDLQKEPDYWFDALTHITKPKNDPIKNENYGDIELMTKDWLNWARQNKYIS